MNQSDDFAFNGILEVSLFIKIMLGILIQAKKELFTKIRFVHVKF